MSDPREYNREYTKALSHQARVRMGYSTERGDVLRFVVQLEYNRDGDWLEVVRFDHDAAGEQGHDVAEEGVHMDVYRDDKKYRTEEIFPPMPAGQALTHAEEHLSLHAERYIQRFETWHRTDHESQ